MLIKIQQRVIEGQVYGPHRGQYAVLEKGRDIYTIKAQPKILVNEPTEFQRKLLSLDRPDLALRAYEVGKAAHSGQTRKNSKKPYFSHPIEVARLVMTITNDADMVAAALLHDTVEDTDTTLLDITKSLNTQVAQYVAELTTPPFQGAKQEQENERLATISSDAAKIKICDIIHNTSDSLGDWYLKEKAEALKSLEHANQPQLLAIARAQCSYLKQD